MATDERIQVYEHKMTKTLEGLTKELVTIRAGRANPHILDKLTVDYYGTPTPLQQVANITVPEARMIQIQPWEASLIKEISKAILSSDLNLNPNSDGKIIRLVLPELTEERRKELQKKEKELRTKIELETAKAEVKKNEEIRKIVEEAYGQVDGADLETFRQFMQEQAGKRKQQEEEFKGYDLGGI